MINGVNDDLIVQLLKEYRYDDAEAVIEKQELPSGIDVECDELDDEDSCQDKKEAKTMRRAAHENQLTKSKFSYTFRLLKSDDPTVVYGVVYEPCPQGQLCPLDSQGDYASQSELTKAAHGFLEKYGQGSAGVTENHARPVKAAVVESGITRAPFALDGQIVPVGSWVAGVKLNDPALVRKVQSGQLNAFSIGGEGVRVPNAQRTITKSSRDGVPTELRDLTINDLSLVKSGANKRRFSIIRKVDALERDFENEIERLEKTIGGTRMNQTEELRKSTDEAVAFAKDLLDQAAKGMVRKGEALTYEQAHVEMQQREPEAAQIAATAPGTILIFPDDVEKADTGYAFDEEQPVSDEEQNALATVKKMKDRFDSMRAKPDVEIQKIALRKMENNPRLTKEQAETEAWAENPELWEEYNARQIRSVDPQSSQAQYYE